MSADPFAPPPWAAPPTGAPARGAVPTGAPPPWAAPPTGAPAWSAQPTDRTSGGGAGPAWGPPPATSSGRRWAGWPRELAAAVAVAAVTVLLGAPTGLVWSALAPRAALVKTAEGVDLRSPETKAFVGADGTFALTVLVVGLLAGAAAVLLVRRRRTGALLGAAAGGLAAAAVAAAVGHRVGYSAFVALRDHAAAGSRGQAYLSLRSTGAVLVWPAAAAAGALLTGLLERPRRILGAAQPSVEAVSLASSP